VLTQILHRYEKSKLFSEIEAWNLFRLAALSEAVGWSLLIIGVIINHYNLPGHSISIIIAGQIHGTIFLIYFAVLLAVYGSSGWSRKKIIIAALAGIPPYGTFVFEQWASYDRQHKLAKAHLSNLLLVLLSE
jgi:integral membrane protein